MAKHKTYTLQVGGKGKERLEILNHSCNPFTFELLDKLPSLEGKKVLEVACGIGIMTYEFSRRVGKTGEVVGIDISEEQIKVAQGLMKDKSHGNVTFKVLPAEELDQLGATFDLVFCRFMLCHIPEPLNIIDQMIARLNPGGLLILEEPIGYEPMFSYPESPTFDQFKHIHILQTQAFNTDFHIGKKLCHWLQERKLDTVNDQIIQPLLKTEYEKRQLWLGTQEISDTLIKKGLISSEEIAKAIEDTKQYAEDDQYHTAFVQYRQIAARK